MASRITKSGKRHGVHKREGPRGTTWHAIVDLGEDPATGKRRQKRMQAETRAKLEEKIADVLSRIANGGSMFDSRMTVGAFLDQWLATLATSVRPNTVLTYQLQVERWIRPTIGHRLLTRLLPADVQRMVESATDAGTAARSVRRLVVTLRTALNVAVRWQLIPSNVARLVPPPRLEPRPMQTWTVEQVNAVLAAAKGDSLECLWRLAITTGMRRGELLALRWEDVDLAKAVVSVKQTMTRNAQANWTIGPPKTVSSRRSIAISAEDVALLKAHRKWQAEQRLKATTWDERGFVFTTQRGSFFSGGSFDYRYNRIVEKAKVPRIRFHDLRHTAATLMLMGGEHPKVVQERLGHSSVTMTLDLYSHVSPTMQEAAAERMERLLKGGA